MQYLSKITPGFIDNCLLGALSRGENMVFLFELLFWWLGINNIVIDLLELGVSRDAIFFVPMKNIVLINYVLL